MGRHETEIWWSVASIAALLLVAFVRERSSKTSIPYLVALFVLTMGSIVYGAAVLEGTGLASLIPGLPVAAVLVVAWVVELVRARGKRHDSSRPTHHDTS